MSRRPRLLDGARRDDGSAVVDFVLVGALLTLIFVAIVQLAVALHVRNTLIDAATEGARYGARAGATPDSGAQRARELIRSDLSGRYAGSVTASTEEVEGVNTVVVRVRAPLPLIGLFGVGRTVDVSGHALVEEP
jgi:Flp pilus assembly protein TadG